MLSDARKEKAEKAEKKKAEKNWWVGLIIGIFLAIAGVLVDILCWTPIATSIVMRIFGVTIALDGVIRLVYVFAIRKEISKLFVKNEKGEIVEVNDGYARNFILKTKKGIEANAKNMNDLKLKKQNDDKVAQQQYEVHVSKKYKKELYLFLSIAPILYLLLILNLQLKLVRMEGHSGLYHLRKLLQQ